MSSPVHDGAASVTEHNAAVRTQFALQASSFTDTGFAARGLDWIVDEVNPSSADLMVDVAAGAAHLGRAFAPRIAHVSAIDLTPEMLEQGRTLAQLAGIRNISFLQGDAMSLPWISDQFDLAACRLTLHQVADPGLVVREMARVTRPGGRVAVIDLTAPDGQSTAAEMNRIERLRDPCHGRTLTLTEPRSLLTDVGAEVVHVSQHDQPVDVEDWMERTATPAAVRETIRRRFDDELGGGPATGLRPARDGGGALTLSHIWTLTIAVVGESATG
jgi:SAM-dependent methyltransferase